MEYSHQEILRGRNEAQEIKLVEYEDRRTVQDKLETHKAVSFNSKSEKIEVKTVTENILSGSVKRNSQVSVLKRKTHSELYEDISEKNGREQKIIACSKQIEIRWQEYHRIISHPKHYRAIEMEICKLNVPAIQSTLVDRKGLIPIVCGSDGNCFSRAISHLIYSNEDHYMEIQVQIVIEAVRRKPLHLNDTFLRLGQSPTSPKR